MRAVCVSALAWVTAATVAAAPVSPDKTPLYDCHARDAWTAQKAAWCCEFNNIGCTTARVPAPDKKPVEIKDEKNPLDGKEPVADTNVPGSAAPKATKHSRSLDEQVGTPSHEDCVVSLLLYSLASVLGGAVLCGLVALTMQRHRSSKAAEEIPDVGTDLEFVSLVDLESQDDPLAWASTE